MTKNLRVIACAAVLALGLSASAPAFMQWTEFPGVLIRGTADDVLTVIGGAVVGSLANPSVQELDVTSKTDGLSGGIRVARADGSYLILNMDDGGASAFGSIQAGDGSNFRPLRLQPNGGGVHLVTGSAAAPSISFSADPTTGLYASGGGVAVAITGAFGGRFTLVQGAPSLDLGGGGAFGAGAVAGSSINIGRNSSGSGAPGAINMVSRTGAVSAIWVDTSGVVRVGTTPTEASGDTGGTIVGTQTSARASKHIVGEVRDAAAAMAIMRATPIYQFTYRDGRYNGETFYGITTDDSPLFGMDGGRSFNPVTAFGATVLALRNLDERLAALERENAALRAALAEARR